MSYFEAREQNVDLLDRSKFEFITHFADYIRASNGEVNEKFGSYFPRLTICKGTENLEVSPPILMVGSDAPQRHLFGDYWADNLATLKRTPDMELERHAVYGYRKAAAEGNYCDFCETRIDLDTGPLRIEFVRQISLLKTRGDVRFFSLAAKILDCQTLQ